MKREFQPLFVFVFGLALGVGRARLETEKQSSGILDNIIIKILDSLRPHLADLTTGFQTFETGRQEFGNFWGYFNEVTVKGIDQFQIETLQTSLLNIKNLTLVQAKIKASGFYKISGDLVFPLGKNDISLFGEGPFGAEISNLSFSFKMKLRHENGMNIVKDFDIIVHVKTLKFRLTNLMGGGELEKVFNRLMNDVGLTVFDYYKDPVLEAVKPRVIQFLNEMLNRNEYSTCLHRALGDGIDEYIDVATLCGSL